MSDGVIRFLRMLGLNRAVGYGVLTRVWGVIAGPVSILIIASRFSKEQQGFYYTINSLLAMQVLFELGLTGVIATFASHEFVNLRWCERGLIDGDPHSLSRFADLLSKAAKWFWGAAILLVLALIPTGLFFFGAEQHGAVDFAWRIPWCLAVIGTALNLMIIPFFAIMMGSGDVVTVNHREMVGGIIGTCISWLVMGLHGGLYAACAVSFGNVIISWSYLLRQRPELLKLAWKGMFHRKEAGDDGLSWQDEVWPLQWRSAVTWGAGYFIFQIFNPVLFHYQGPVVAGRMGMTMSACNALLAVCVTWINAKSPEFGKYIALRQWGELDRYFAKVFRESVILVVAGAVAGWSAIYFLQAHFVIGQRFLPASQVAILLSAMVILIVNHCIAAYLRAHKQEPLMVASLISSALYATSTLVFGKYYSSGGIITGFLTITAVYCLPVVYFIWRRSQKLWHTP